MPCAELSQYQNTASVSSDEEEGRTQLQTVKQKLLTYDPTFWVEPTYVAPFAQLFSIHVRLPAIVHGWRWTGYGRPDAPDILVIGRAWIYSSSEPWRDYEAWRVRSMAGVDSAELGNVPQNVLASFSFGDRGL
jgi:hypothetical protein